MARWGIGRAGILWVLRHELIPSAEVSPTRLADHFLVQPSVITGALAKLEAAGLITRAVDPGDSRVFRIAITKRGRLLSEHVESFFEDEVFDSLAGLDEGELAALRQSVETLDRISDVLLQRRVKKLTRRAKQASPPGARDHSTSQ